jgi:hypothetical protein
MAERAVTARAFSQASTEFKAAPSAAGFSLDLLRLVRIVQSVETTRHAAHKRLRCETPSAAELPLAFHGTKGLSSAHLLGNAGLGCQSAGALETRQRRPFVSVVGGGPIGQGHHTTSHASLMGNMVTFATLASHILGTTSIAFLFGGTFLGHGSLDTAIVGSTASLPGAATGRCPWFAHKGIAGGQ